ncbi:TolC family protein [Flavobacterium filum]|uniref:TolC family protein n=1 Tax=Flavobacterium filum TaxID=370974 RepID=UPI00047A8FEE|nr:TolC family protein [Flavobacterium filum]
MKKVILMLIAFTLSVNAQEAKTLSLKDAINYALENKADAKKAKLSVENSEHLIGEVRSRALPQISAQGNLMYNAILQEMAMPGEIVGLPGQTLLVAFGQKWTAIGGIHLSQNLFDYSVFTGLKAAKTTREFYKVNEQLTQEQVIEAVSKSYYQIFITRQKLETVDETLENTAKVQNTVQGLFDNGLAKKVDLDRIKVTVVNLKSSKQQLENAVKLQENSLKFLIGMQIENPITLIEERIEITPVLLENPNVKQLSQYQALEVQKQLLIYNKESFKAGYYPTLSLTGNYSYQGLGEKFPLSGAKPADGLFWTDYATIGLNLNIPIFSGFRTRSQVRQAQNQLDVLEVDMQETEQALNLAFENAKTQINNSVITIENQKENVKLAQEVLDNTNNNYVNGLATLTDLIEAENALADAKNNLSNALLEYKVAEIELIKSKGELNSLR